MKKMIIRPDERNSVVDRYKNKVLRKIKKEGFGEFINDNDMKKIKLSFSDGISAQRCALEILFDMEYCGL